MKRAKEHGNWIPCATCRFFFPTYLTSLYTHTYFFVLRHVVSWFRLSVTKRWVSEVIHIMMCTVVCSGWKAHSLVWEWESFVYTYWYSVLCECVCVCALTRCVVHIYISVEWENDLLLNEVSLQCELYALCIWLHVTSSYLALAMAIWPYVNAVEHWNWHRKCCCYHFPTGPFFVLATSMRVCVCVCVSIWYIAYLDRETLEYV